MLTASFMSPELAALIRRSHARSRSYGLDPLQVDGAPESSRLSPQDLQQRMEDQKEFLALSKEQIDTLYGLLKGTGFCMALADGEGYILYVVGDADLKEHFKRRRCWPGYRWLEKDLGTCAIGLALEEHEPVFLPGECMFSTDARRLSNAGAPIFAPDGKGVIGAISLSGQAERMHVHTLGLVRQAAETITSHLREREHMRDLTTTNLYLRALVDSDSRGIVTVDSQGRIVQTNRTARHLFHLPAEPAGLDFEDFTGRRGCIREFLAAGRSFRNREILARHSNMTHYASFDPITMPNGAVEGGLLSVLKKKEAMGMAVEMTGSRAHFTFDSILGKSASVQAALHHARIAANSTAPLLLLGETGTGKELFAQAVHNGGERRKGPFVAINCGAIPKELLESELFGYEDGAFTGARKGDIRASLNWQTRARFFWTK